MCMTRETDLERRKLRSVLIEIRQVGKGNIFGGRGVSPNGTSG